MEYWEKPGRKLRNQRLVGLNVVLPMIPVSHYSNIPVQFLPSFQHVQFSLMNHAYRLQQNSIAVLCD